MRILLSLAGVTALLSFVLVHPAIAAERIPPQLAAKRAGAPAVASVDGPLSTPSPLNLIFTPIAGCRAFGGQILGVGSTTNFQITGSGNFTSQGGPSGGCGIPSYAKAVGINLSGTYSSVGGSLTAHATGAARPPIVSLSLQTNATMTTGSVVSLGSSGAISIFASRATKVYGDITGYYEPQLWAYVASSGTLLDQSGRVSNVSKTGTGTYSVAFDRDISSCVGTASSDLTGHIMSVYTSGTLAYVYSVNNAGAAADYWFNLHVMC